MIFFMQIQNKKCNISSSSDSTGIYEEQRYKKIVTIIIKETYF